MLTPEFKLSQDDTFLYIEISAFYAKASETEIYIDKDLFIFYATPYYLKLNLPGQIVEDEEHNNKYEDGKFFLKYPKKIAGKHFDGLDMITSLMTPKGEKTAKGPLIEVLSSDPTEKGIAISESKILSWFNEDNSNNKETKKYKKHKGYGFANQRINVFEKLKDEFKNVLCIECPDDYCMEERMEQKYLKEKEKFNPDHFIADFVDDEEEILNICSYFPPWVEKWKESQQQQIEFHTMIELTSDERYQLTKLPKKEYLIDDSTHLTSVYLGLVDILFAYCYDVRINSGEKNSESGWTISRLSSMMSYLVFFMDLKEVVVSCFRRALIFPLYRNWKLNQLVLSDLLTLLNAGRLQILKSLLRIKGILQEYEMSYILNDLYITDYCVWIQTTDEKTLKSLSNELSKIAIKKDDVDLDLNCWENIALGEMEDFYSNSLAKLGINNQEEDTSSSSSSSLDSDDDDDDSSSETSSEESESSDSSSINEEQDERSVSKSEEVKKEEEVEVKVENEKL